MGYTRRYNRPRLDITAKSDVTSRGVALRALAAALRYNRIESTPTTIYKWDTGYSEMAPIGGENTRKSVIKHTKKTLGKPDKVTYEERKERPTEISQGHVKTPYEIRQEQVNKNKARFYAGINGEILNDDGKMRVLNERGEYEYRDPVYTSQYSPERFDALLSLWDYYTATHPGRALEYVGSQVAGMKAAQLASNWFAGAAKFAPKVHQWFSNSNRFESMYNRGARAFNWSTNKLGALDSSLMKSETMQAISDVSKEAASKVKTGAKAVDAVSSGYDFVNNRHLYFTDFGSGVTSNFNPTSYLKSSAIKAYGLSKTLNDINNILGKLRNNAATDFAVGIGTGALINE